MRGCPHVLCGRVGITLAQYMSILLPYWAHAHASSHSYSASWGNIGGRNHDSELGLFKTLRKLWMSEKFVWFRKLVEDAEVPNMLENVEIAR